MISKFLKNTLLFILPILIILISIFILDPFKVWFSYDNYYNNYSVNINREMVCFKIFKKNKESIDYDSYIFGNSRSQAFKTFDWLNYIDTTSKPFHFDASGEGLYGILNKLRYIDNLEMPINNAIIVVDDGTMTTNYNRQPHLYISPPSLSNDSITEYYLSFIKASLNARLIYSFIDYKINGEYKDYMESYISLFTPKSDNTTADIWYWGYDESIKKDSIKYYSRLVNKGVFYERDSLKQNDNCEVSMSEIEKNQLNEIAEILKKHETDYRIIISPLYNQIPLCNERLEFLKTTFGEEKCFNFSGQNDFTQKIGNYYESSHYRPIVARKIMEIIYDIDCEASL